MAKRTFSTVALVVAILMQGLLAMAPGNAKIVSLFGAEIGVIATSDMYVCLVFAIIRWP